MSRVRVSEELSDTVKIPSGVPQGSIIAPLNTVAFINDLMKEIFLKHVLLMMTEIFTTK